MHTNAENTTETTPSTSTTSVARKPRVKRAKRAARAGNKSKADMARAIFKKMGASKPRKDVIDAFVSKAKLSPAGASTYYQRFSADSGMPKRRKRAKVSPLEQTHRRGRLPGGQTKVDVARAIFAKVGSKKPRKEVLELFVKQAKLSEAGASTYYQKLRSAAA